MSRLSDLRYPRLKAIVRLTAQITILASKSAKGSLNDMDFAGTKKENFTVSSNQGHTTEPQILVNENVDNVVDGNGANSEEDDKQSEVRLI